MKTTIDLPDDLLIEAKQRAARDRTTMRALVERALRRDLKRSGNPAGRRAKVRWVTVDGPLPEGLNLADRAAMIDWLRDDRA